MRTRSLVRGLVVLLVLVPTAMLVLAAPASGAACADEFIGPSEGAWGSAVNWSAGVPGAGTVVCWAPSKAVLVTQGSQAAGAIAAGGSLVVRGDGRLDLAGGAAGGSSLSGTVEAAEAGVLEVDSTLTCSGAALAGGRITVDGAIECPLSINGGTLSGVGAVASVVNEGGTVEPGDGTQPGGLSIGSYAQGPHGTLTVREESAVGGLADHLLRTSGPVSLDGTISLEPGSPPAGFLVVEAASEPQGYFKHVLAPAAGSPWTIGYGSRGATAISGGAAQLLPRIAGALQAGGELTCAVGGTESWTPRGESVYRWGGPILRGPSVGGWPEPEPGSEPLAEALDAYLDAAQGPKITVPGVGVGRRIGCSVIVWTPASSRPTVVVSGESDPVTILGPYRDIQAPAIAGRPIPGRRLTCSPGRWEGEPGSYSYRWVRGERVLAEGPARTVSEEDAGKTLTCIVTAHYGEISVPAEAAVDVPARPQPTLCPARALTLLWARIASGHVTLLGAAVQTYFGATVVALGRRAAGGWRRLATGRVGADGYFVLRVPSRRGGTARSYRVAIGRTVSNVVQTRGILQLAWEVTRPGTAVVDLRLGATAPHAATVTVSPVQGCVPRPSIDAARLAPGGDLRVQLAAERDTGPAYYLARATVGGRTYSVEVIVPARPRLLRE